MARDIAVQMCDVFEQKDYVGVVNVSYMAAVSTASRLYPNLPYFLTTVFICI